MSMIPPYLKEGDTIGIVAPARKISESELAPALSFLQQQGFNVLLGKHLFAEHCQFAGTDSERAEDFQYMLDHVEVKAILCARGGYGAVRIVDRLDFSKFITSPKWICGYSDITVFHSHVQRRYNIATLHTTMPVNAATCTKETLASFVRALKGEPLNYIVPYHPLNRTGSATGILTGGNLSILYSLSGSRSDIDTEKKILFIEDLDEYLYHIDRMMMNIKRSGKLEQLAGLIIGGMNDMNDNAVPYGKTAEEIIAEHCVGYTFPVCFGFPAGHGSENLSLRLGTSCHLNIQQTASYITL